MYNNQMNHMISNLIAVSENDIKINNQINNQVDINTIISNVKKDKRFHKLLSLCIKYDIHLFNQINNQCTLFNIDNLLLQSEHRQQVISKEMSTKIAELSTNGPSNTWMIDIDNIYIEYKKKFKDIEVIIYILKNTFKDETLITLCCIKNNLSSTSTSSPNEQVNLNQFIIKDKEKKDKQSKYIAIYSN
jgi:hypothetical protein